MPMFILNRYQCRREGMVSKHRTADSSFISIFSICLKVWGHISLQKHCYIPPKNNLFFFVTWKSSILRQIQTSYFCLKPITQDDCNSTGAFHSVHGYLGLHHGDCKWVTDFYEVNKEALATLLVVLARWGLPARSVSEKQALTLEEFLKRQKLDTPDNIH